MVYRAAVLLKHLGHFKKAAEYFVYLTDRSCSDWVPAELVFIVARVYEQLGDHKLAAAGYERAFDASRLEHRFGAPRTHSADKGFQFENHAKDHAKAGETDAAAGDGSEDAFNSGISGHRDMVPRLQSREEGAWRAWVQGRQPWERMAERAWRLGEFSLALDMLSESLRRLVAEETVLRVKLEHCDEELRDLGATALKIDR